MSFEAESNSELTVLVPAYQLHFRFLVQNKIHKQQILSDTRTSILGNIAGPCDFLKIMKNVVVLKTLNSGPAQFQ
jgi:hypothetical protein